MSAAYVLMAAGIFFVLFNVVFSIIIVNELSKRKIKVNFFLIRLLIIKYVHQYKTITLQETGKVGNLFYCWVGSINLALVCSVIGIILL